MTVQIIYDQLSERFDSVDVPDWYDDAVLRLRGGADRAFGLYLYNLVRRDPSIETVVNIGTARGFSATCLARAIFEREATGTVHTIDTIPPDQPRDWHAEGHDPADPARDETLSVHDLMEPFQPEDGQLSIRHHTGDSLDVLESWNDAPIDLVFHDGRHTYEHVSREISLAIREGGAAPPLLIFDDCFLYENEWTQWLVTEDGPLEFLDRIPYLRRLPEYAILRKRSAGVARAVEAAFEEGQWARLEIIREDWAPITALIP